MTEAAETKQKNNDIRAVLVKIHEKKIGLIVPCLASKVHESSPTFCHPTIQKIRDCQLKVRRIIEGLRFCFDGWHFVQ